MTNQNKSRCLLSTMAQKWKKAWFNNHTPSKRYQPKFQTYLDKNWPHLQLVSIFYFFLYRPWPWNLAKVTESNTLVGKTQCAWIPSSGFECDCNKTEKQEHDMKQAEKLIHQQLSHSPQHKASEGAAHQQEYREWRRAPLWRPHSLSISASPGWAHSCGSWNGSCCPWVLHRWCDSCPQSTCRSLWRCLHVPARCDACTPLRQSGRPHTHWQTGPEEVIRCDAENIKSSRLQPLFIFWRRFFVVYFFMFIYNSVFALLTEFSGLGQNKCYRIILVQHILYTNRT